MSGGSIKLAALLKDVAEKPQTPAAARVSLDVLKDAEAISKAPLVRARVLRVGTPVAAMLVVAGVFGLAHKPEWIILTKETAMAPVAADTAAKQSKSVPSGYNKNEFSKPVQELMEYVECFRKDRCAFKATVPGEEAAKQFGYSRLFVNAYDEVSLKAKSRTQNYSGLNRNDVLSDFESIVAEEQAIDRLLKQKDWHAASIAYLRALQNGDVTFPAPETLAPVPQILMIQLMSAYPAVKFDINDATFAEIYRKTRQFATVRVKNSGELWAQEIIAEWRKLIVQSTESPARGTVTLCDRANAIGVLVAIQGTCSHLRFSKPISVALDELSSDQTLRTCKEEAAGKAYAALRAKSVNEITTICNQVNGRIRAGEMSALELAD